MKILGVGVHGPPMFYGRYGYDTNELCSSVQQVLHDRYNNGRVFWMVHIKDPLRLIGNSSPCSGDSGVLSRY